MSSRYQARTDGRDKHYVRDTKAGRNLVTRYATYTGAIDAAKAKNESSSRCIRCGCKNGEHIIDCPLNPENEG